jgi:hypothetical protein
MYLHVGEMVIVEEGSIVFFDVVRPDSSFGEGVGSAICKVLESFYQQVELLQCIFLLV